MSDKKQSGHSGAWCATCQEWRSSRVRGSTEICYGCDQPLSGSIPAADLALQILESLRRIEAAMPRLAKALRMIEDDRPRCRCSDSACVCDGFVGACRSCINGRHTWESIPGANNETR